MKKLLVLVLALLSITVSKSQTTILSEGFNVTSRTTTPPTGWTCTGTGTNGALCSTAYTWEQVPSGGFVCVASGGGNPLPSSHTGTGMAGYNSWDIYSGGKSELVTPVLDFSGPGTTTFNVWIYNAVTYNPGYDSLKIYVNTAPTSAGANSTMLYVGTPSYSTNTGWTQYSYNIPTTYTTNTNYIIFRAASLYANDIYFDDVEVIRNPPIPCAGTPTAPVITTAALSVATSPICTGTTKTITAVDPNFPTIGGITYQWQTSTSATGPWTNVSTGTGGTTLTYTTPSMTSSAYFRMGSLCVASGVTSYTAAYLVPVGAPQPGAITGNLVFCPGDPATYSVPNVTGTTYTWTLPSGWSGVPSGNSILVTPGSATGTISVTATTTCGISAPQTLAMNTTGSVPAQPGTINGSASICSNSSQTYSITPIPGATNYIWTLPFGWTGTSTTNTITTTATTTGGNVTVIAANGCGQSSPQVLAVNVVNSLPNPGTITGDVSPCSGSMQTYSINPVPGATSYTWTLPSGWSGTTTTTSIVAFAGTSGGNVSVTAFAPCASSPVASLPVTVITSLTPTVSITGSSALICQGVPILFTAAATNGGTAPLYQWKKNGVNVSGAGNTYLDNSLVTGDVINVVMTSSFVCPTSSTANSNAITASVTPSAVPGININTTPTINICKGTPLTFNTNITGGGTTPAYQWFKNSSAIGVGGNGASYTDPGLLNNDTITVQLTTNAVCATTPTAMSNKVLVSVTDPVTPAISISASSTVLNGAPITFTAVQTGGGATPQYQWMKNNVDIPLATGDTYVATGLSNGDRITVKMLSYAPCANPELVTSNEIQVNSPLSIANVGGWDGTLSLYPNPNGGHFSIAAAWNASHNGKTVTIDILNAIGQNVYHAEAAPDKAQWHYEVQLTESLPNGSYMLRLSADHMKGTLPFILNR